MPLWQSYTLNLNRDIFRQLLYRHAAPRGFVLDPSFVLSIHLRKISHVGEKDLSLDNLV